MAKVPLGKVLLRNVIRHTDAHNKARHQLQAFISLFVVHVFGMSAHLPLICALIYKEVPKTLVVAVIRT